MSLAFSATPRAAVTYTLVGGTRFSVKGNGNVGIGTTTPQSLLQVGATDTSVPTWSTANTIFYGALSTAGIGTTDVISFSRAFNQGTSFGKYAAIALGGYTAGSNRQSRMDFKLSNATDAATQTIMTLQGNGNVGIGTTAPALPLDVYGASSSPPATSGTVPTGIAAFKTANNNNLYIGANTASPYGFWFQVANSSNLASWYPILLNPNGGKVGIGNTAPVATLEVSVPTGQGSIRASDGTSPTSYYAEIYGYANHADIGGLRTIGGNLIKYSDSSSGNPRTSIGVGDKLTIQDGGNVGIGNISPSSTLDVVGNIELPSTGSVLLGAPATDGTWRITTNGTSLSFQIYSG